jgi:serine/threonine-protein kinase
MRYCQICHRCFGDGAEYCLFDQTPTFLVEQLPVVIDGKYRLEELIAHGGMGSVYRALHQQLERPVAIKILRAEFLTDRVIAERFNREARAAAKLKHPNIVAIYDFGFLPNGGAYLVMELIEGRSLREEMRTYATGREDLGLGVRVGKMMRPERVVAILSQVCAGIEVAHRQGIVHRDLKPDNVMIETTTESAERVLVLDFGIAKLKDRDQGVRGITDENTVIGTPNYISPEQCTGQTVDQRSDIYSLGVILYEMLTGRTPFAAQNTSAVLLRHLQEPPTPPSRFRTGLSKELEQVVLRALAKNPSHRYPSAAQFAEHLSAAVAASQRFLEEAPDESEESNETLVRPALIPLIPDGELTGVHLKPATWAEPIKSPPSSEVVEVKAPTLLIERQSRAGFNAAVIVLALALVGFFSYLWLNDLPAKADETAGIASGNKSDAGAENAAPAVGKGDSGSSAGAQNNNGIAKNTRDANSNGGGPQDGVKRPETAETNGAKITPISSVNVSKVDSLTANEAATREVKSLYSDWVNSAVRGDWGKNLNFYADRVDYFRDGFLTRAEVGARKRRIFGNLNSYSLKFTQSPQVTLRTVNGALEADISFDRQWRLQQKQNRKSVEGKARGLITLRHEARGWRIVSEKQVRK